MIRTVTGNIESYDGNVLMHEHIQCASDAMLRCFHGRWIDEDKLERLAIEVLTRLKREHGVGLYVDATPSDLGRNVRLLERVSKKSGVYIVASSGLYSFPAAMSTSRSPEQLAAIFLDECKNGLESTAILPGILKCAADAEVPTRDEIARVSALAIVQRQTGLSLYAHSLHRGDSAHIMLDQLISSGANPEKIAVGHCGLRPDADYLERLLERGCKICVDQCFSGHETEVAKAIAELSRRGYSGSIFCSLDRPIYSDFQADGHTGIELSADVHFDGYAFLFTHMLPAFEREGCTSAQCDSFVSGNSIKFLTEE